MDGGRPVPVKAAFGGIVVLRMASVRSQNLRWDGSRGCEHWSFCLEAGAAGQVLACPRSRRWFYTTNHVVGVKAIASAVSAN